MTISQLMGNTEGFETTYLKPENIFYIGLRDVDPPEAKRLKELKIKTYLAGNKNLDRVVKAIVRDLEKKKKRFYVSFDLDVLDSSFAPGVNYNPKESKGLSPRQCKQLLKSLLDSNNICGFGVVEYNPLKDINKKTRKVLFDILASL